MDVWFNFPDLIAFKIQMDQPPRQGEFVRANNIPYDCFRSYNEWALHLDKKHNNDEWIVTRVVFTILPIGSYANVMLQRAPATFPGHN